jgi:tetratricopeptide (TPR) repeat protein
VSLAPGRADIHGNLGNVLHDLKRYEDALASFDRALKIGPDNAQAIYYRGIVLRDSDRHSKTFRIPRHLLNT